MNRIPLYRQREPWVTGVVALLGLAVIAALVAWLWRPSKTIQAVPAPLDASSPVATVSEPGAAAPAQARRALATSGRWSRLSAGDQEILAPLKEDWADLSVEQRLKWLDLSLRFPTLAPEEQQRVQERMAQWARLSTVERGAARLNFQEIRQFSAKERMEQWEAYKSLEPGERKQLAVQAQAAAQNPAVPKRSESSAPVPKSSAGASEALAGAVARPVSGTLVQAPIGATTQLVTQLPTSTAAPASGPRLAAPPGAVDPVTLLPQARAARPAAPVPTGTEPATGGPEEPAAPSTNADQAPTAPGGATTVPTGGTP